MLSNKKSISAHQLHRTLQVTYETAWFMEHRLHEDLLAPVGGALHRIVEYVIPEDSPIPTNIIEGRLSIFKRDMKGTYRHCAKKHLHRYLAEFDIQYDNWVALGVGDIERAGQALLGTEEKQLTYSDSFGAMSQSVAKAARL